MSTLFYRLHADRSRDDVSLENVFAGPMPSACWLIGGGPSLNRLPHAEIAASPVPKMCLNLAGAQLLRPTFWTSYDPSVRFHRSIYLDAGVMKFVHRRRAIDLVPETTFKVCECPNTFFFDRDGDRGFADFLSSLNGGIVDWADSMVQAIDILYRLGFRVIYLAGCEMQVQPSAAQRRHARAAGVSFTPGKQLQEFLRECEEAGLSSDEIDALEPGPHYHFDEHKPIRAAATTDSHYFRVAQYLRLVRRSLSIAGMQLISVTPHSRLNDYFPYRPARHVLRSISQRIGDPTCEPVRGLYRQIAIRHSQRLGPMRDFLPHHWSPEGRPKSPGGNDILPPNPLPGEIHIEDEGFTRRPLNEKLNRVPADYIDPEEDG